MTISAATNTTGGLARMLTRLSPLPEGGVPVSDLKRVEPSMMRTLSSVAVARAPVAAPPSLIDPTSMLDAMKDAGVTSDDDPSKLFAEVYKDGKVVARLYNGGSSTTYGKAEGIISGENEPYDSGPQLAQWRANRIASALGGTVKMADTAQTQSQWAITSAAETAKRDQAMAPYRAAMDAFRAQMDAWTSQASQTTSTTA